MDKNPSFTEAGSGAGSGAAFGERCAPFEDSRSPVICHGNAFLALYVSSTLIKTTDFVSNRMTLPQTVNERRRHRDSYCLKAVIA